MGTSGDKIVLLDGMGSGSGSATNGLLSMIPGMFANLIGGNKMDPNLVAALMNGRNNQDGFGGANGWWLWIIVLFWLWGGRGFGNGFGNGGENCANGLPAQLNNDYGRELLMQAIQGNRSAIEQIANALNCTTTQLQSAICNVQGAIDKVAGQVGMTSQDITFPRSWLGKPLTRCLTPTDPREDGRWRTLSRCSINAGLRNLITPLGEISNTCSLCSIATTFLRYWIATRK